MHSKSDSLGYLKDQKRDIFWGVLPSGPVEGLKALPKTPKL